MSRTPKRPATVPAQARWVPDDEEWEQGTIAPDGQRTGAFTYWRADGTKCNECTFVGGKTHGPFKRFHENGEVSQDGEFVAGELHGTRRWFACDAPTTERMHERGVSEKVRRSEMDYVRGRVVAVRHFDAQGRRVSPSGEPYPERPAGVPEGAEFRPDESVWTTGEANGETAAREGEWRTWTADGRLVEVAQYVEGQRHGDATLQAIAGPSPFRDARITAESGRFENGAPVGTWRMLDAQGQTVATVHYGSYESFGPRIAAFANVGRADWGEVAAEAMARDAIAERLCALAREAAVTRSPKHLLDTLAKVARPLTPAAAQELAAQTEPELQELAIALIRGAAPGPILRQLGILLDQAGQSRAALDFVNAALLVSPDSTDFLFTRALVLMSLGLKEQAERDASELAAASPGQAEFLLDYLRILFPSFGFWPANEKPVTTYDGLPDAPARSLEEVRLLAQKYATRLQLVRDALLELVSPQVPWMLPDLAPLLPDGPAALERDSFELAAQEEDDEPSTVEIDETLAVEDADLPTLVRLARADWCALAWLCWSAGLDRVALPEALEPPEDFGQAAGMSAQRLWRSRDQRVFGGRNAKAQNIPGFEWEGADVAELHPNLASIAEQQYAEMKALFLWLSDPEVRSPWQDNLRGS